MSLALVLYHLQEQTGLSPEALGPSILPTVVKARIIKQLKDSVLPKK